MKLNVAVPSPPIGRDALTGLTSRQAGLATLQGSLNHSGQLALLLCDIDRFRLFNMQFGHDRGDEQLRRIARDLQRICGKSPVFRLGGDVFTVILHEASLEQAREVADKILASQMSVVLSPMGYEPTEALSLSIGIALFPFHASTAENLLQAADIALLKAKRGGRLADGTAYTGRNRALTWGDFIDEFPHQSAQFLRPDFMELNS